MGGRGSSSASAKMADERFYDMQRAGFRRIAESYDKSGLLRNRLIAAVAAAAAELVGTDRARSLLASPELKRMYLALSGEYDVIGAGIRTDLDKLLDNKALNKPLGSRRSDSEWQDFKSQIQLLHSLLERKGYSDYEIAAALAYGRYLVR